MHSVRKAGHIGKNNGIKELTHKKVGRRQNPIVDG